MRAKVLLICHATALAGLPWMAGLPADPGRAALEDLVRNAQDHHPGLSALRQEVLASEAAVGPAGALPDPTLDAELAMISARSPRLDDALARGSSVGFSQALPFPGKRRLRRDAAAAEAVSAALKFEAAKAWLRRDVTEAALRHALNRRLLDLNLDTRSALESAVQSATSLYAAGRTVQADVLLAQATLTESSRERLDLERRLAVSEARLADLSGGALDRDALARVDLPPPGPLPPLDECLSAALRRSPEIGLARSRLASRDLLVQVAESDFKPDFALSARYRFDDPAMGGGDFITLMAAVSLPLFHARDRYGPARAGALARREGERFQVIETENRIRFEVSEAWQTAKQEADVAVLVEGGLLLQARQAYEAGVAGYAAGRTDFTALLQSLRALFQNRALVWTARTEHHGAVARLAAQTGGALPEEEKKPLPGPGSSAEKEGSP